MPRAHYLAGHPDFLYFHPSTSNAISFYRTVPVLPEGSGRVEEVYVNVRDKGKGGQPIFKLDSSEQEAALETARRRLSEVDAEIASATSEIGSGGRPHPRGAGRVSAKPAGTANQSRIARQARGFRFPARDREARDIGRRPRSRCGDGQRKQGNHRSSDSSVLPAQKASAAAQAAQAQVELDKMVVRAGIDGTLEQFTLRRGDIVNPLMRPAGVLIPSDAGRWGLVAGSINWKPR